MASAKPKLVSPAPTLGQLADRAKQLAIERAELSAKDKLLKEEYDALKQQIIEALDAQGTRVAEGKIARVSIVESEEPQTEDWQKFLAWARKTNNLHLVQQRISAPAWREIRAMKKAEIPGIGVFHKRDLNIRVVPAK